MVVIGAGMDGNLQLLARRAHALGRGELPGRGQASPAAPPIMMLGPHGRTGFSGWSYYLMRALQNEVADDRSVSCIDLKISKSVAAAWAVGHRSSRRFYTLTPPFLDRQVAGMSDLAKYNWIVGFQIAPKALITRSINYYMYVDMTIDYYISNYGLKISRNTEQTLREAERRSYESAKGIFCYEDGTKREIIENFAVRPSKVHVVGRGVNIDDHDAPFTIGFHGRDPQRKGLYRLIAAMDEFDDAELAGLRLMVIGPKPHEVPRRSYIDYRGWFGARDRRALVDTLKAVDVGFLASSGDVMPGGVFELLSLGKPVITTELPGLSRDRGRGFLFIDPEVSSSDLRRAIKESRTLASRMSPSCTDISWSSVARRILEVGV